MGQSFGQIIKQFTKQINEFQNETNLTEHDLLVIGCSTSEIVGKQIGTAGSEIAASIIFEQLRKLCEQTNVNLAFQCCEHLNRALVIERHVQLKYNYEEVTVIPSRDAGGAMATFAFEHFEDPVIVEKIAANAGIDIGDTFIGMHLKDVAVPVRTSSDKLGNAHITFAKTRPKLIGGPRSVYERKE